MSLLAGIDKLISQVAGPLVFEQAQLLRTGAASIDPATGQTSSANAPEDIKAIEEDYSAFHRASLGIPSVQRKINVIGYGVDIPRAGDQVNLRGIVWEISSVGNESAGALYTCHAVPVGVAADPGATQNLLTGVAGQIAGIAGPLLFNDAIIYSRTEGLDANGQATIQQTPQDALALETDYTNFHRAAASIPETHRKLMVIGYGLDPVPKPGDSIALDGTLWEIVESTRDPARAVYEFQSKPIGEAVRIIYASHSGTLSRIEGTAAATVQFAEHFGILAGVQGSANASVDITLSHAAALARVAGSAEAGANADSAGAGVLARLQGSALAASGVSVAHAGFLQRSVAGAAASAGVTGSHAGTLAPITGQAEATQADIIEAQHIGSLAPVAGFATGSSVIAAQADTGPSRVSGTANAETGATAGGVSGLARIQGSANSQTLVSGQSGAILARTASFAAAGATPGAAHAGTLGRISGAGEGVTAVSGAHAGALAGIAGSASGVVGWPILSASHAGTLGRLLGSASADAIISASHVGALAGIQGAATGTVEQAGTLWTPADLASVTLNTWLDAQDAASITKDGSNKVSAWADKSGNGNNATQGTSALQPLYQAADTDLNGYPSIGPTGADERLGFASPIMIDDWTFDGRFGFEINLFGQTVSIGTAPQGAIYAGIWQTATHGGDNLFWKNGVNFTSQGGSTQEPTAGGIFLATYVNSAGENNLGKLTSDTTPQQLFNRADGTRAYDGQLGELVLFDGTISTDDRQKLEGYMAHRWGYASELDAGHPYKSAPPYVASLPERSASHAGTLAAIAGSATATGGNTASHAGTLAAIAGTATGTVTQPAASVPWTPEVAFGADLLVWADLADASTITLDGSSRVDAITNKGSISATFAAQAASKPLYSATGRNSLPAMINDNTWDNGLAASIGASLPSGDAESTMVAVGWMTVNDGNATALLNWGDLTTANAYRWITGYFGDLYADYGATGPLGGEPWVNSDAIMSAGHEPGTNYATRDGTDYASTSEGTLVTTTAQPFQIIRAPNAGVQEVMVLNRLLTADETLKLHGYLAHKWGLTALLPSGHPYKSAAPTMVAPVPVVESASSAANTHTVNAPAGIQEGDLLIASFIKYDAGGPTITPPAGWTQFGAQENQGSISRIWAKKIATASEPSTYTFTSTGGAYPCAEILRISGAGASPVIDGPATPGTGNDTTREYSSQEVAVDNSLQILASLGYSGQPTAPAGWDTVQVFDLVNGTYSRAVDAGTASSGVVNQSQSSHWLNGSIVIRPGL